MSLPPTFPRHSLFLVVSGRSFVSYRARKLKIISSPPTCIPLLYFGKNFFFLHSAIYGLLGQLRIYWSFLSFNILSFTGPTCRECWLSKLIKTLLPIQLVVIKLCSELELRVFCACVALWLVELF